MKICLFLVCWLLAAFTGVLWAQTPAVSDSAYIRDNFVKHEYRIPMRDGVRLHTIAYVPRETGRTCPIILYRTPYRIAPYGDTLATSLRTPNPQMLRQGYIWVYQDVRGMFMSEGRFEDMRPHLAQKKQKTDTDESTDTYDTIEWLLKTLKGRHNGRVGQWGISYPGFYSAAGLMSAHPALRAVSPQAPIADWWYDDFHHHGALFLPHSFGFISGFGLPRKGLTTEWQARDWQYGTEDGYEFYLHRMGPVGNANTRFMKHRVPFWDSLCAHPNYDGFWQARNILPHLKGLHPHTAVLTVGGWYDAEDLYGPLKIYRTLERHNPRNANTLVMGPWVHGGWLRTAGDQLGPVHFGQNTSQFYQDSIIQPFFDFYLKDEGAMTLPEAWMFETGRNRWQRLDQWPPAGIDTQRVWLQPKGLLGWDPPQTGTPYTEFISDPDKPVPFQERISLNMDRAYMVDDQRFAARRPDVLVFQTDILQEDLTLAGPILAHLLVSTDHQDADWIIKLIDVYPDTHPGYPHNPAGVVEGGMQQMVRSEVIRGRFRHSMEHPQPFVSHQPDSVRLELQDVLHTFKKGHRLMIQVQSTWFPIVDRNPQRWVDNLYTLTDPGVFEKATHRVYHGKTQLSWIDIPVWNPRP
ncbi:MAG: CocE/NonD family hydrolase [Bacteroidetes bacterium]|nr:CocE/NonD family hydrolase [Bacteroidota bacterium]